MEAEIESIISLKDVNLVFYVPNEVARWRVTTFWEKEPETLLWIDGFNPQDFFMDIGANIGLYSFYAAYKRGVDVIAFEPESGNYALLNKNIFLNKMDKKIKAYPFAISDEMAMDELHLSHFGEGNSLHNFKEKLNYKNEPFDPDFSQGCFSMSLDEMVQRGFTRVPQHIKIDVDGIEDKILRGASELLFDHKVKSVLVELNTNLPSHLAMIDFMQERGFTYSRYQAISSTPNHGLFQGIGNYIFYRE